MARAGKPIGQRDRVSPVTEFRNAMSTIPRNDIDWLFDDTPLAPVLPASVAIAAPIALHTAYALPVSFPKIVPRSVGSSSSIEEKEKHDMLIGGRSMNSESVVRQDTQLDVNFFSTPRYKAQVRIKTFRESFRRGLKI